jgi:uncharacterized protein YjbI with pentapeptide repeats
MNGLTVDKQNVRNVAWDEDCFKYCEFVGITPEGEHITADFTDCVFKDIDWYWGIFNIVNFVNCKFTNCVFRGTSFSDCKFVECELDGCRFIKDNLNGDCSFDRAVAYNCKISNCEGFKVPKGASQ